MIDKYKDGQANIYNTLVNECCVNRLSHAYLIDVNNNADGLNIVIDFVKYILCPFRCKGKCNDVNCKICHYIDDNAYTSFKIINSDGMWIKKEQLLNLQKEFSMKSIDNSKKIYIINEAEKLNLSAANTMLKFLEEPEDDIIAFLLTNNVNLILDTIKSRCQYIKLNNSYAVNSNSNLHIKDIFDFVRYLEFNKYNTIIYYKLYWPDLFSSRNDSLDVMDVIIDIYMNILYCFLGKKTDKYGDYYDVISDIVSNNNLDKLLNKITMLVIAREEIKSNANLSLFVDNLVIKLGGEL